MQPGVLLSYYELPRHHYRQGLQYQYSSKYLATLQLTALLIKPRFPRNQSGVWVL
jgi:hypothetical protein